MVFCWDPGADDASHMGLQLMMPVPPIICASVKSRMVYPYGTGLPRLSWKKRPLNERCRCVMSPVTHGTHISI